MLIQVNTNKMYSLSSHALGKPEAGNQRLIPVTQDPPLLGSHVNVTQSRHCSPALDHIHPWACLELLPLLSSPAAAAAPKAAGFGTATLLSCQWLLAFILLNDSICHGWLQQEHTEVPRPGLHQLCLPQDKGQGDTGRQQPPVCPMENPAWATLPEPGAAKRLIIKGENALLIFYLII